MKKLNISVFVLLNLIFLKPNLPLAGNNDNIVLPEEVKETLEKIEKRSTDEYLKYQNANLALSENHKIKRAELFKSLQACNDTGQCANIMNDIMFFDDIYEKQILALTKTGNLIALLRLQDFSINILKSASGFIQSELKSFNSTLGNIVVSPVGIAFATLSLNYNPEAPGPVHALPIWTGYFNQREFFFTMLAQQSVSFFTKNERGKELFVQMDICYGSKIPFGYFFPNSQAQDLVPYEQWITGLGFRESGYNPTPKNLSSELDRMPSLMTNISRGIDQKFLNQFHLRELFSGKDPNPLSLDRENHRQWEIYCNQNTIDAIQGNQIYICYYNKLEN